MSTPIYKTVCLLALLAAMTACSGPIVSDIQATRPSIGNDDTPLIRTAAATVSPPPPTTPIPATSTSEPKTADPWTNYDNAFYAYTVRFPAETQIEVRGAEFVSAELVPVDMTEAEFLNQVMAIYPDNICLTLLYQQGFVTILAPRDNGGRFVGICGLGGIGAYEIIEQEETLLIDGQTYTAVGAELWEQGDDKSFFGGFGLVTLADGTFITYGSTPFLATANDSSEARLAYEDFLSLKETLQEIVSSYSSTGTAVWPKLPDSEPIDFSLPAAAWVMPEEGPFPGSRLSYALSTGEQAGTHGEGDFQDSDLAAASFRANEPVTIRVDSTAVTAFRARIVDSHPMGGRTVSSLLATGEVEGDAVIFTLTQPGYRENQYLRIRLDFIGPVTGFVEYAWKLLPNENSLPLAPTPVIATNAPPACALPSTPPSATATPASDQSWAQLLEETAPETLALQADLIIMGLADNVSITRRSWSSSIGYGTTVGIVTDTAVQITCSLRGTPASSSLTVRTEGGCLGEDGMSSAACMVASHGVQLVLEQPLILFLKNEGSEYVTVRRADGRYTVQTTPETYRVFAEDGMYLVTEDQAAATPRHVYEVAELLLRIAAAPKSNE